MLIDYEYACYNYRGFDLGNHFCEYLTFDIDLSKYPSKDKQMLFLRAYAKAFAIEERKQQRVRGKRTEGEREDGRADGEGELESSNNNGTGEDGEDVVVSEEELEALYREVNQYALASHLFWGIW